MIFLRNKTTEITQEEKWILATGTPVKHGPKR